MSDLTPSEQDELGRRLEAEHAREVAKWDDHRCPWRDMVAFHRQVDGWVWCERYDMPVEYVHKLPGRWVDDRPREGIRTWVKDDCDGPHRPLLTDAPSTPDQPLPDAGGAA